MLSIHAEFGLMKIHGSSTHVHVSQMCKRLELLWTAISFLG